MRVAPHGLLSIAAAMALVLAPGLARAEDANGELWDGQVRLDLSAEYERLRPEDPDGPLVRTSELSPRLTGQYFLTPLVGEESGPLALLEFYQHPGELHISLGDLTDFNRVDAAWTTTRRALVVGAGGTSYPWHETGIHAEISATYAGQAAESHSALELDYQLGLVHYFRPNLRGELTYVGSVSQTTRLVNSTAQPALQDLDDATNAGRVSAEAVLLDDRLGVQAQLEIGQFTQDRTNTEVGGGAIPGDFTSGLLFNAQATVTGYFGRQFSASLNGGIRGRSANTQPDQSGIDASTRSSLAPFLSPSATYFFRDDLFLVVSYEIDFTDVSSAGAPSSTAIDQTVNAALAWRF